MLAEKEGLRGVKTIGIQSARYATAGADRGCHAERDGCICLGRLDYAKCKIACMRRRASGDVMFCKTTNIPAPKPPNMVSD